MTKLSAPRTKTVKRLFALSGNRCAFAVCQAAVVDASGTVVGEICHIKGASADGPRYDAEQSDEDRHGFNNLLILCPTHHKVVDDDEVTYTVEALNKLKSAHESSAREVESTDRVVDALLAKLQAQSVQAVQSAGVGGTNVVAGGHAIVVVGPSYDTMRQIALDVWKANALELQGLAQDIARRRAEDLTNRFLEKLSGDSDKLNSLSDPDMQHSLFVAQREAARAGNDDLTAMLVDLLVDRASCPERDLQQIVLNESLKVAGLLTSDQFDALTIVFMLKYTRDLTVRKPADLCTFFDTYVQPFLSSASRTRARYQHMQYTGCGALGTDSANIDRLIVRTYNHCFSTDVEHATAVNLLGTEASLEDLVAARFLTVDPNDSTKLLIAPLFDNESESIFSQAKMPPGSHKRFRDHMMKSAESQTKLGDLMRLHPGYRELAEFWKEHPAHFTLTSVGIAIAHANLRRRGVGRFDLTIWIH